MADIVGLEGRSKDVLAQELARGGRFVVFPYVISVLILTYRRSSPIHYIPPGVSPLSKGIQYLLLTLALGWWGFPWGFIWTPMALITLLRGGTDVTREISEALFAQPQAPQPQPQPQLQPQPAANAATSPALGPVPPPAAGLCHVRFRSGALAGQRLPIPAGGTYLGRDPGPGGLAVPDDRVSRQHCWIGPLPTGGLCLVDMNSTNGTQVNQVRATPMQQVPVRPGDQICMGGADGTVLVLEP